MAWWDDLWLNEAFATWMAYKIVDAWNPGWRVWLDFDQGKAGALQLDALRSTHPIRAEVRSVAEAGEAFDLITYEKGGAVLRMIEGYLGEERFREGIRLYMRRHGRGNTVADDLWGALAEASQRAGGGAGQRLDPPARLPARLGLARSGRSCASSSAASARTRPTPAAGEPSGRCRWCSAGPGRAGARSGACCSGSRCAEVELDAGGGLRSAPTPAATGFYRVAYDAAGLDRPALRNLAGARARRADPAPLRRVGAGPGRRAGGRRRSSTCAPRFQGESDHAVLDELVGRLAAVEHRLVADEDRPARCSASWPACSAPSSRRPGGTRRRAEPDAVRLRRAAAVRALGLVARDAGVDAGGDRAAGSLARGASGRPWSRTCTTWRWRMAARGGDRARFEALPGAVPERERSGLPAPVPHGARAPSRIRRWRPRASSSSTRRMRVPLQDTAFYLGALLGEPDGARAGVGPGARGSWEALYGRIRGAPMLTRRVVEAMGVARRAPPPRGGGGLPRRRTRWRRPARPSRRRWSGCARRWRCASAARRRSRAGWRGRGKLRRP